MKKLLAVLIALTMLLGTTAALASEQESHEHLDEEGALVVNPMHDVATFEELVAAVPGVQLSPVPEGATDVSYTWIHTEPTIAQIQFQYEGHFYTYRAAVLVDHDNPADIDGIYLAFDHEEGFDNTFEGDDDYLHVRSNTEDTYALIDWSRVDVGTQYSLFSETAGEPNMDIIETAVILLPAGDDWWTMPDDE